MRPVASTEMVMFSGLVSRISLRSFGSVTGMEVVTTGIVIRKMMSKTSITSTSGVVLIAETTSSSSPSLGPTLIAMIYLSTLHRRRFHGDTEQHRMQVRAEPSHAIHCRLVAAAQPVVAEHRRHGDRKAERGHDQRFPDWARNLVDGRLPRNADGRKRVVDSPDRAEQAHEGSGGAHRGEKSQSILRAGLNVVDGALDRHRHPCVEIDVAKQSRVLAGCLEAGLGDESIRTAGFQAFSALTHR